MRFTYKAVRHRPLLSFLAAVGQAGADIIFKVLRRLSQERSNLISGNSSGFCFTRAEVASFASVVPSTGRSSIVVRITKTDLLMIFDFMSLSFFVSGKRFSYSVIIEEFDRRIEKLFIAHPEPLYTRLIPVSAESACLCLSRSWPALLYIYSTEGMQSESYILMMQNKILKE